MSIIPCYKVFSTFESTIVILIFNAEIENKIEKVPLSTDFEKSIIFKNYKFFTL